MRHPQPLSATSLGQTASRCIVNKVRQRLLLLLLLRPCIDGRAVWFVHQDWFLGNTKHVPTCLSVSLGSCYSQRKMSYRETTWPLADVKARAQTFASVQSGQPETFFKLNERFTWFLADIFSGWFCSDKISQSSCRPTRHMPFVDRIKSYETHLPRRKGWPPVPGAEQRDWQGDVKTTSRQTIHRWINDVNNERDARHQGRQFTTEHLDGESSVSKPPDCQSTPTGCYCRPCIMNKKQFKPPLSAVTAAQRDLTAEIRQ